MWSLPISLKFYQDLAHQKFWQVGGIFLLSLWWLGLISAWRLTFVTLPKVAEEISQDLAGWQAEFPDQLLITWDGRQLSGNSSLTASLSFPAFLKVENNSLVFPEAFVTWIPRTEPLADLVTQLPTSTYFMVTPDKVFVSDLGGNWSELAVDQLLAETPPLSLNKTTFTQFTLAAQESLQLILRDWAWVLILLQSLIFVLSKTLGVLINTVVLFFLISLYRLKISFGYLLKITLTIKIMAEGIGLLHWLLLPQLNFSVASAAFWILSLWILWQLLAGAGTVKAPKV